MRVVMWPVLATSMCIVLPFELTALGQSSVPDALTQAITERQAAMRKHDATAYGRTLAEDLTSVDRAGWLRDKSAAIADMLASPEAAATAPNRAIQMYADAAIYSTDNGGRASVIQAWAREGDRWVMVAMQGTTRENGAAPTPATANSSILPSSVGAAVDIAAVKRAIELADDAVARRDVGAWSALATEHFVGTGPAGEFLARDEWVARAQLFNRQVRSTSIRIHGTMAVAVDRLVRVSTTVGLIRFSGRFR